MKGYIGENIAVDYGFIAIGVGDGGASSAHSQTYALGDYDRIAVICQMSSAAASDGTKADTEYGNFSIVVGKATEGGSSMVALTGATLNIGSATAGKVNKAQEVKLISAGASITTGTTVYIDGITFTFDAATTIADKILINAGATLALDALCSAINYWLPDIEYTRTAGSSVMYIRRRQGMDCRSGVDVQVGTNDTATGLYVESQKTVGMIEFTPQDVLGINSSYDAFAVRLVGTTISNFSAMVLRSGGRNPKQQKQTIV